MDLTAEIQDLEIEIEVIKKTLIGLAEASNTTLYVPTTRYHEILTDLNLEIIRNKARMEVLISKRGETHESKDAGSC